MGTYIVNSIKHGKFGKVGILKQHGAEEIPVMPVWPEIEADSGFAYVCVVYGVEHDAALLITSQGDVRAVTDPSDRRPRAFLRIPESKLQELP